MKSRGSAPTLTSPCCVRKATIGHLLFQCQTVGERGAETIAYCPKFRTPGTLADSRGSL